MKEIIHFQQRVLNWRCPSVGFMTIVFSSIDIIMLLDWCIVTRINMFRTLAIRRQSSITTSTFWLLRLDVNSLAKMIWGRITKPIPRETLRISLLFSVKAVWAATFSRHKSVNISDTASSISAFVTSLGNIFWKQRRAENRNASRGVTLNSKLSFCWT